MKDKIESFIQECHEKSNGSCGTYVVNLISEFKIGYAELRPILKELVSEKKIRTRKGINGTLVMIKTN